MPDLKKPDLGVHPGHVIAGKYRVERVLGAGGMGVVVAAHHVQLDTKVAVKLLLPELLANREAVARFEREAQAVAKITSEHVARILDVGTLETGVPYMVMEYLEGEDLDQWLQKKGPLEIELAVEFILHACVAVAEAHGLGIVHRDLKPANLFCVRRADGQLSVKVLDFGISKVTLEAGYTDLRRHGVTKKFEVMGSPLYMSPEQMKSARHADAQSDVWALGVILYELLSGNLPFIGESETDIAINVASLQPQALRSFRPDVPPALEAVVLKCLEKDKGRRYLNVADLACDLAPFAPTRAWPSIERITGTIETARLARSSPQLPSASVGAVEVEVELDVERPADKGDLPGSITLRGHTTPGARAGAGHGGPRGGVVAAVTLTGLLVIGGAGVFLNRGGPATATRSLASAIVPVEPTGSVTVPSGDVGPMAAPTGNAASSQPSLPFPEPVASAASAPSPSAVPASTVAAARVHGAPAKATSAEGHTSPPSSSRCDPPFTFDAQGRKHFKPECF